MLQVSKVVFVAFTQQCIQSNVTHVTHVGGVEGELYSVYSGLSSLPGGKAIRAFHLWSLAVNYNVDCRQNAQPIPILKN